MMVRGHDGAWPSKYYVCTTARGPPSIMFVRRRVALQILFLYDGAWSSKADCGFCPTQRLFALGCVAVETLEARHSLQKVGKL